MTKITVIPATPGYYALARQYNEHGVLEALDKSPIIAWQIEQHAPVKDEWDNDLWNASVLPITTTGTRRHGAVLRADGVVEIPLADENAAGDPLNEGDSFPRIEQYFTFLLDGETPEVVAARAEIAEKPAILH